MKTFIPTIVILFGFLGSQTILADESVHRLITVDPEVAKAAAKSYGDGNFRFIQDGQLIEAYQVDESKPSCILEMGKMLFNPELKYKLESVRSLDADSETGEIELNFETASSDPDSYFQIYCYQGTPGADLDTAREGLKSVFQIQ